MVRWIDCGDYWELQAPQGDPIWLEGRKGRTTGSVSGALAGNSNFKTPEQVGKIIAGIEAEDFTEEALERMNHGHEFENSARDWYSSYAKVKIVERGLIVPKIDSEIGASVDGDIVGTDTIIEIKCPVQMYGPLEQYMLQLKVGWKPPKGYYKHIYPTHFAQMQHTMFVMGKKYCIYIVYSTSDKKVFTQKIPFSPEYWSDHYSKIKTNYDKHVRPHLNGTYPLVPH